jgi:hypothetical protein
MGRDVVLNPDSPDPMTDFAATEFASDLMSKVIARMSSTSWRFKHSFMMFATGTCNGGYFKHYDVIHSLDKNVLSS